MTPEPAKFADKPAAWRWCPACAIARPTYIALDQLGANPVEYLRCCSNCSRILKRGATEAEVSR